MGHDHAHGGGHDHGHSHGHKHGKSSKASESTPLLGAQNSGAGVVGPRHGCGQVVAAAGRNKKHINRMFIASMFCLVFMIAEAVGGYFANSLAIFTDAIHLCSDLISFGISIAALYVAQRPATERLSFGFYRAEIMGAFFSVFLIWILTVGLVIEAIRRIYFGFTVGHMPVDGRIMFCTAALGIIVNVSMAGILGLGGHSHSHSHSHTVSSAAVQKAKDVVATADVESGKAPKKSSGHSHDHNVNIRAALIHVIGDLVQSVGILIAATIIWLRPQYWIADPICTLLFAVLVFGTTVPLIKESTMVLMEGTPAHVSAVGVEQDLRTIIGVTEVHDLHIWSLAQGRVALAVHLTVKNASEQGARILQEAQQLLNDNWSIDHTTIQLEDRTHLDNCAQSNRCCYGESDCSHIASPAGGTGKQVGSAAF